MKPSLSEDAAALLQVIKDMGAVHVHQDDWPLIEQLSQYKLVTISEPYGPSNAYKNVTPLAR